MALIRDGVAKRGTSGKVVTVKNMYIYKVERGTIRDYTVVVMCSHFAKERANEWWFGGGEINEM